jgi:asparagine synthase (glutamine-hydrolysing)
MRSRIDVTPSGAARRFYWHPALDAPPPYRRDEDYIARARELFDRAVARALRDTPRVAVMMSGGLDSSAVAATAARQGHGDITCYTAVPPEDAETRSERGRYPSERPKVEALARMHPTLRLKLVTPRGMHPAYADSTRRFSRLGHPVWCPVHQGWIDTVEDEIAAGDHRVVLNGVLGNFGLSWTGDLSLVALAGQMWWIELVRQARAIAKQRRRPLRSIIKSELVRPLVPERPVRWLARRQNPNPMPPFCLINPVAVEALDLRRHWHNDDYYPPSVSLGVMTWQRRARGLFDSAQANRDRMAASPFTLVYEMRDPHGDRELLEFCLSVPETLYRRNGISRWFARQVFSDRLPPEILKEERRGLQCSNWFEAFDARKPIVEAAIDDFETSPLARLLIDIPRLKQRVAEWPGSTSDANARMLDFRFALDRAVHIGEFIRWVERGQPAAYGS